jgi:hypothetical protein
MVQPTSIAALARVGSSKPVIPRTARVQESATPVVPAASYDDEDDGPAEGEVRVVEEGDIIAEYARAAASAPAPRPAPRSVPAPVAAKPRPVVERTLTLGELLAERALRASKTAAPVNESLSGPALVMGMLGTRRR